MTGQWRKVARPASRQRWALQAKLLGYQQEGSFLPPLLFFFLSLKAGVVLNSISSEILFTFQIVAVVMVVLGFHCSVAAVHRLLIAACGLSCRGVQTLEHLISVVKACRLSPIVAHKGFSS